MSASTPEQQPYEVEKQEIDDLDKCFHKASENRFSEQLLRRFSRAPETKQTSANVMAYSLGQEQNDEKAVGNVQQLRDSHWNVLVIPARRREWDPGDRTILSSTLNKYIVCVHDSSSSRLMTTIKIAP